MLYADVSRMLYADVPVEVFDDGVDDAIRQRILLVEQRADEDGLGARVSH
jgi:hypothetical protein